MADIVKWPGWLKSALARGFEVQVDDRRTKTDTDTGTLIRVDFPNVDTAVARGQLLLDPLAANFFEAFERDKLVQGTRWFQFPLWVGGQCLLHEVRFLERISWGEKTGGYIYYDFVLQVGSRLGLMGEDLVDWLVENDPQVLFDGAIALANLTDRLHVILCIKNPQYMLLY